jgi:hypothetical protein
MTMPNQHVFGRLAGIQQMLVGAHKAGGPLSSASKGAEREHFVDAFLSQVFPPPFRFGHGDVTDSAGRGSGQLDVVVEFPFLPSLPIVGCDSSRLYLAEGVGAVIEVKSDVAGQWGDVISTANQLSPLRRNFGATSFMGQPPSARIPLYAVGYTGWKETDTLQKHLPDAEVDGVLVIDSGLYYGRTATASGPWSLWALIAGIHEAISSLKSISAHPDEYAR